MNYPYRHQEPYQYQTAERLLELLEVFYWKGDIYRKQQFIHLTVRGVPYILEVMETAVDISRDGIPVNGAFGTDVAKLAMEVLKVIEVDSKRVARKRS